MQKVEGRIPPAAYDESLATARLDVPHPAPDLRVLRVAGSVPEGGGVLIVICDQGGNPPNAAIAKIVLGGADQLKADASTTVVRVDGESVDVSAPAVPAGDHRADDLAIHFRDEEGGWTLREKALDMLFTVGRARV
jgi:hypothetical protein